MDELTPAEERYFASRGTAAPDAEADSAGSGAAPRSEPMTADAADKAAAAAQIEAKTEAARVAPPPEGAREQRRVPLSELLSERERRRNAENALALDRARLSAIESELGALAANDGELPDGEKEPQAYAKALAARAEKVKAALGHLRAAAAAQARQSEVGQHVMAAVGDQTAEFARRQPDYEAARQFLEADREAELAALGIADPLTRAQMIVDDKAMIIARALMDGVNVAERVYALARRRGYKPGASEAEKLALAERGQAAGKSLGSASGGAAPALSAEALAALSDREFADATKGERWKRLWE